MIIFLSLHFLIIHFTVNLYWRFKIIGHCSTSYNLPLDEFMNVMEQAIMKGYTFAWGADVSKKVLVLEMAWQLFLKMNQPSKNLERIVKRFNDAGAIKS